MLVTMIKGCANYVKDAVFMSPILTRQQGSVGWCDSWSLNSQSIKRAHVKRFALLNTVWHPLKLFGRDNNKPKTVHAEVLQYKLSLSYTTNPYGHGKSLRDSDSLSNS